MFGESFFGVITALLLFRVVLFAVKIDTESKMISKKGKASLEAYEKFYKISI